MVWILEDRETQAAVCAKSTHMGTRLTREKSTIDPMIIRTISPGGRLLAAIGAV